MSTTRNIRQGKAWEDSGRWDRGPQIGQKSGWFIGPHGKILDALGDIGAFEVKWHKHPSNDRSLPETTSGPITLSILVSGRFEVRFRETDADEWVSHELTEPGDYLVWGANLQHEWTALDDSIVLTVRPVPRKTLSEAA